MKKKCKEDAVGCNSWIRKAGIFAKVAKILLGLQNFARIAKISQS